MSPLTRTFLALVSLSTLAAAQGRGEVYSQTNDAAGNTVMTFSRAPQGQLLMSSVTPTQGLGTDSGLGSQGAVVLTRDGEFLLVVNAGSNDVTVFAVGDDGLAVRDVEPSRGIMPVSVSERDGLVYVLNAGSDGNGIENNIAGFTLSDTGDLDPLPQAPLDLSQAGAGAAQVSISRHSHQVYVTEKATSLIDLYPVNDDGTLGALTSVASAGMTPFGFGFGHGSTLIVSEAFGGAADGGAVSSYEASGGALSTVSGSVPCEETAPCWIAVTKNGRYAYTTNTGSGTVTGYAVSPSGALTILNDDGVTGDLGDGTNPLDAALSTNSHSLYVLSPATGEIASFQVRKDGSLHKLESAFGLPSTAVGLAAR